MKSFFFLVGTFKDNCVRETTSGVSTGTVPVWGRPEKGWRASCLEVSVFHTINMFDGGIIIVIINLEYYTECSFVSHFDHHRTHARHCLIRGSVWGLFGVCGKLSYMSFLHMLISYGKTSHKRYWDRSATDPKQTTPFWTIVCALAISSRAFAPLAFFPVL